MAYFEDPYKILRYVRKAFIEHDESGLCAEIVGDKLPPKKELFPTLMDSYESEEDERSSSADDYSDWDFEKKDLKRFKFVGTSPDKQGDEETEEDNSKEENAGVSPALSGDQEIMFERKEVNKNKKVGRSLLSFQLEQRSPPAPNPFVSYTKFDGSNELRAPTKSFRIFLTMLDPSERDYPISVTVQTFATVTELIGLTCFKYTAENPNGSVKLKEDLSEYALYISDERGDVDWEFPALDPNVQVGKFCLQYLALVELSEMNVPKEWVMQKTLVSPEDGDTDKEQNKEAQVEAVQQFIKDMKTMASLVHETFRVDLFYKKRKKVGVNLAISLDKLGIELDPGSESGGKAPKVSDISREFDAREIVACELLKRKPHNRTIFRIVNHAEDALGRDCYKNNDFESDTDTADKIIAKLNSVLEMRGSALRDNYRRRTREEKRHGMKRIFSLFCR